MTNNKNFVERSGTPDTESEVSLNISDLRDIGKTMVTDKFPITTDSFWFILDPDVIVNPFDFVTVENVHDTKTIGIVKELQTVTIDGFYYHSLLQDQKGKQNPFPTDPQKSGQIPPVYEITTAKVAIMANTGTNIEKTKNRISISMPLRLRDQ